jgi:hypothetical protein
MGCLGVQKGLLEYCQGWCSSRICVWILYGAVDFLTVGSEFPKMLLRGLREARLPVLVVLSALTSSYHRFGL